MTWTPKFAGGDAWRIEGSPCSYGYSKQQAEEICNAHNATLSQRPTPATDASKQNPQCPTCGQRVPDSLLEKIVDAVMEPATPSAAHAHCLYCGGSDKHSPHCARYYEKGGDATCPANQSSNTSTDAIPRGSEAAPKVQSLSVAAHASEPWTP